MESLGESFLPYQKAFIEDAMMVDEHGEYVAREACLNLPRQCGKTFAGIARVLYGALVEEEALICLSSHQQATSRESFKKILAYFEDFSDLSKRVHRVVSAIGRESIDLKSGVSIRFPSRTRQSTRGWSVNLLLVDECQLLTDEQWSAARPAMSARKGSSAWLLGTAPELPTDGPVIGRLRNIALEGGNGRLCWHEYGSDPGDDADDIAVWAKSNPGMVQLDSVRAERIELSDWAFRTERLNEWPTAEGVQNVFVLDAWQKLVAPTPDEKVAAIGVDSSPEGHISVAVCRLLPDERKHVRLAMVTGANADPRPIVDKIVAWAGRRTPIAIFSDSLAAEMIEPLEGLRVKVKVVGTRDISRAATMFANEIKFGRLTHEQPVGADGVVNPVLDDAVKAAVALPVGEGGLWKPGSDGSAIVSPVIAAMLSVHAAAGERRRSGRAVFA
ncbi:MAG: terminase family protein [Mycolicibacterium sp.]|uniref:terminase large subunit domain-containing protein n=1 Tax=Mycolicibacterium sp. TaxID=2320850 RepID=UPI003D11E9CF